MQATLTTGVVPIVLAWFVAPLLGGAASATIFALCRTLVLRHANAYNRSYWVLPPIVLLTAFVNIYFVFTKGAKKVRGCMAVTIRFQDDVCCTALVINS